MKTLFFPNAALNNCHNTGETDFENGSKFFSFFFEPSRQLFQVERYLCDFCQSSVVWRRHMGKFSEDGHVAVSGDGFSVAQIGLRGPVENHPRNRDSPRSGCFDGEQRGVDGAEDIGRNDDELEVRLRYQISVGEMRVQRDQKAAGAFGDHHLGPLDPLMKKLRDDVLVDLFALLLGREMG